MQTIARLLGAASVMAALVLGAQSAQASPIGVWIDHTGRGAIEIRSCGASLCGHIVWLKSTNHSKACGVQVIGGVKPVGSQRWDGGWIFDPDENSRYNVEVTSLSADRLKVMGYAGSKFLSETMIWRRAPADLKRCTA